jgi:hypothetical protein
MSLSAAGDTPAVVGRHVAALLDGHLHQGPEGATRHVKTVTKRNGFGRVIK